MCCTLRASKRNVFENADDYEKVKGAYVIDPAIMKAANAKRDMIVMHPLPRVTEISMDFDDDPPRSVFPSDGVWFVCENGIAGDGVRKGIKLLTAKHAKSAKI